VDEILLIVITNNETETFIFSKICNCTQHFIKSFEINARERLSGGKNESRQLTRAQ
jgi:hypothetical protein